MKLPSTRSIVAACLFASLGISGYSQTADAAGSILDATYSPGGLSGDGITGYGNGVDKTNGTFGRALAVQADGKVLVAGTYDLGGGDTDAVVLRYNADGTPDNTFGNTFLADGQTRVFSWGGDGADKANAITLDSDGKIIVVGTYDYGAGNTNVWMMRLNQDGSLDTSFNGTGDIVFESPGTDAGNGVAVDGNGKIVVVGTDDIGGGVTFAWIARLNSNGTYDNTFNFIDATHYGNIAISGDPGEDGVAKAVAIQSDNKIVVTGSKDTGNGNTAMWALRLTDAGVLDTTFNTTGEIGLGTNGDHIGNAVAIDANGKIVLVGTYDWSNHVTNSAQGNDIWLQRLNSDGSPDTSFYINGGTGGVTYGGTGNDNGSGVLIQPNGMILVTGTYDLGTGTAAWIQRVKTNGQPSTTFNNGSASYTISGTGNFAGSAAALQNGPEIILAGRGFVDAGSTSTIMTARLHGTTYPLTVTITGNGTVTADNGTLDYTDNVGVEYYFPGEFVTLTPAASTGYTFSAWGGACQNQGATCSVTIDAAKDVTATFAQIIPELTLNIVENGNAPSFGSGTVTITPPGTTHNTGVFNDSYPFNTEVTMSAAPAWHSVFSGWSGACVNATGQCVVTMDAATKSVDAIFNPNYRVKVTVPGTKLYSIITNDYLADFQNATVLTLQVQAFAFPEVLPTYTMTATMNFQGGMDTNFLTETGFTTVNAPLKISAGRMNIKNLKVH